MALSSGRSGHSVYSGFSFDGREIRDIVISTLALGAIFSIGGGFSIPYALMIILIVALSFIPHELAHKYMAVKYNCFARYEMWKEGLVLAFLLAIATNGSFVFAAPGAVVIYTAFRTPYGVHQIKLSKEQNGLISSAGPLTNIAIALFFLAGGALVSKSAISASIIHINLFLAAFNLLPIPPLDGSKVISWNALVWLALIGTAGGLLFLL